MRIFQSISVGRRQSGFSLVELMIAMVLGLLVVGAIIQLFMGSRATQMSNDALARVQENARFSLELLKGEFRDLGTHGFCGGDLIITSHLNSCGSNPVGALFNADQPIVGWEYQNSGRGDTVTLDAESDLVPATGANNWTKSGTGSTVNLPAFLDGEVVAGSDVVALRRLVPVPGVWANGIQAVGSDLSLNASHGLASGTLTMVTNCATGADLFQNSATGSTLAAATGACSSSSGPGNRSMNWSTSYDETMQVFRVDTHVYFVGYDTNREEPGLYRARVTEGISNIQIEELVEGVETMQVLYGYSLPANQGGDGQSVDFWLAADEVPDWDFVIGARLNLLLRSAEGMAGGAVQRSFDLGNTTFTHPEDQRLRQPFYTTISLRNRQLVM